MEKGNKNRLFIWGGIWLVCLLIGVGGLFSYYKGYGRIGQARKRLIPVVDAFNAQDSIIRYGGISAEVSGDKIIVTHSTNSSTKKFEYKYAVENGISTITNGYSKNDNLLGETIAKGMINAVYQLNGGSGSVFEEFQYNVLTNLTIDKGANLLVGEVNQIKINLDTNIVKNIKDLQGSIEDSQINYINSNDLSTLKNDLKEKGYAKFEKNNIVLLVVEKETNYEIYATDSDMSSEDLKNSIANVILELNSEAWSESISKDERFTTASESNNYKVETDYVISDDVRKEFSDYAKIVKITVLK